jgi:DNA sulfur modification protein DndC
MSYYKISNSTITLTREKIERIKHEYLRDKRPWSIAFSGGKDSSALLKLVYLALAQLNEATKPVTISYCDSGVEIPIIRSLVIQTLGSLSREAKENNVPFRTEIVFPPLKDKYFSKVIGRGYPVPSFKFRWCTDVLWVRPIRRFIKSVDGQSIILLGIRKGESIERDRVLSRYKTSHDYYYHQADNKNVLIYSPIIEYQTADIWAVLNQESKLESINTEKLQILYSIFD